MLVQVCECNIAEEDYVFSFYFIMYNSAEMGSAIIRSTIEGCFAFKLRP